MFAHCDENSAFQEEIRTKAHQSIHKFLRVTLIINVACSVSNKQLTLNSQPSWGGGAIFVRNDGRKFTVQQRTNNSRSVDSRSKNRVVERMTLRGAPRRGDGGDKEAGREERAIYFSDHRWQWDIIRYWKHAPLYNDVTVPAAVWKGTHSETPSVRSARE